MPVIEGLWVYPVKSCQGISVQSWEITRVGLRFDRAFAIFDEDNEVQDIRVQPKMCTIRPSFEHDAAGRVAVLLLTSTELEMDVLRVPLDGPYGDAVEVRDRVQDKWWGSPLQGMCCGVEAAKWVTRVLEHHAPRMSGRRYRLVRYNEDADSRRLSRAFGGKSILAKRSGPHDTTSFADCAPVHLLSVESLEGLNSRLAAAEEEIVTLHRFRPNIVVSGSGGPNREDNWDLFAIDLQVPHPYAGGDQVQARFRMLGETGRCVIPTTHPFTGRRHPGEQPREMLKSYRPMPYGDGPHGGPTFGVWLACDAPQGAILRVGQRLSVEQSKL